MAEPSKRTAKKAKTAAATFRYATGATWGVPLLRSKAPATIHTLATNTQITAKMASRDAIKLELSGPDTGNIPNANRSPFGFRRVVTKTSRNRMCLLSTGDSFDDHNRHAAYPR